MTAVVYRPEHWQASPPPGEMPRLVGGRCLECRTVFFPRFDVCPGCMSTQPMAEVMLSGRGVLYTYSVVHTAVPGFATPYAVAYVDLPEGPRVFGHLDLDPAGVELGSEVGIYPGPIGRDAAGHEIVSIRFRRSAAGAGRGAAA